MNLLILKSTLEPGQRNWRGQRRLSCLTPGKFLKYMISTSETVGF